MKFGVLKLTQTRVKLSFLTRQNTTYSAYTSNLVRPLPATSTTYPQTVRIGSVTKVITAPPKAPHLVPNPGRVARLVSNTDLGHLEWMLKKDNMGQDMFLIGPPGTYKRKLVGLFANICSREVEFVQLSRDTTEADIKQRREIKHKSAVFFDQPSVRTALNGHVLVLDGIEKAERNVLPVLNNLLENREMQLEDGRHLIPHTRYDSLLQEFGPEAITKWKLERVHEHFRVIALGLPVPAFKGNPLDPPLRSRFQARSVEGVTRDEVIDTMRMAYGIHNAKAAFQDSVGQIVDLAYAVNFTKDKSFKEFNPESFDVEKLPWFVVDNLVPAVAVLQNHVTSLNEPKYSRTFLPELLRLTYPFQGKHIDSVVHDHVKPPSPATPYPLLPTTVVDMSTLTPCPLDSQAETLSLLTTFINTGTGRAALLYGPQGCGKSMIADYVAASRGQAAVHVQVYKDMSTRDLFQTRTTDSEGNTVWRLSALTNAIVNGDVCVLDGVENLHESVFNVLGRLVQDGELLLPDGVTRVSSNVQAGDSISLQIHPNFRVLALANSSDLKLSPEISSVFFTFHVQLRDGEEDVLVGDARAQVLLDVARELKKRGEDGDKGCATFARGLSVTQVRRIARRVREREASGGSASVYSDAVDSVLGMFAPALDRELLGDVLLKFGVKPDKKKGQAGGQVEKKRVSVEGSTVRVGSVTAPIRPDDAFKPKVPSALFYDIDEHVAVLESLVRDFVAGDHLLLIGNQGVGKNKLVDKMLMMLNTPREYVQLHRDTTVQSLTTHQRVEHGIVKTDDSPLVSAARHGLVLVVDEADKAPAHVTAVLKTLAERGEMLLPDGRRITRTPTDRQECIRLHPDFRMIVLANRPGFPFLGNNFYTVLSHLFSINPISNPSIESEVQLLESYGKSVENARLAKIASVFSQLRKLSDEGVISYPYSTREAVHIVKHLEVFPGDLRGAFRNVFDFDSWTEDGWKTVTGVVGKEFGDEVLGVASHDPVVKEIEVVAGDLNKPHGGEGGVSPRQDFSQFNDPKFGKVDPTGAPHVGGGTWAGGSGGMGTAGLGGAGGPFRLTDGNPVFQVSDEAKAAVPPEVREKARQMARRAFEEKLRELKMTEYDGRVYEEYVSPIRGEIQSLRTILESLQAKAKERKWVRHQTSGDLDDGKLIEGIVGERNIYRMRKDENPEVGDPIVKPKLLRLIVDCSGSMYRFNGYDKRMDRQMSSVLMVLESFSSFEDLFKYEIYIHSGDDYDLKVVDKEKPPKTQKERIDVMKLMFLHSQFCSSGDHTLEATVHSIKELKKVEDDFDEVFLIVMSDANLERYGIKAEDFAKVLGNDPDIKGFTVFIGSLGDQAERLVAGIGASKAYTCLDTSRLPKILQRIFVQNMLID